MPILFSPPPPGNVCLPTQGNGYIIPNSEDSAGSDGSRASDKKTVYKSGNVTLALDTTVVCCRKKACARFLICDQIKTRFEPGDIENAYGIVFDIRLEKDKKHKDH